MSKGDPLVCAIMLTRDRPAMAARAVESFRRQTYENKTLLLYNNGDSDEIECGCSAEAFHVKILGTHGLSIGILRNAANAFRTGYHPNGPDIIVHWDDDDWSHPNRIADQVALLQRSGADAVGYREMLFWRDEIKQAWLFTGATPNYALGTSLCYWRKTWQRRPFLNETQGVEEKWCADLKVVSVSAMSYHGKPEHIPVEPRMIASIHGGNTSTGYDLERHVAMGSQQWRRVPEWDEYARERMAL